ncbi:RimK family alpha-L-glutamate ligase [Patescibacteria group bacterium]|nr:MAG: RimK family alpha-L-glutamate ligase [Patescibacteria group bacterium]
MNIGILIFSEPRDEVFAGADQLVEAGQHAGHSVVKLYEPRLSFYESKIFHDGKLLPAFDVIISRPNFIEEPSLRTYAIQLLKDAGYPIVNGNVGFTWAKNKLTQHILFTEHHLPCPRWSIARKPDDAVVMAKKIGFPSIVKVAFGTHGKGVLLAKDEESLWPIVDYLGIRDGNPVIIEEFIAEAKSSDLRAFVIGGKVVAAMQRTAGEGDMRANTSNGGIGSIVELSEEERALAIRAADIFGLEIAGVDLIRSKRGTLILEINANPGFKELEAVTGLSIARKIIDYAVSTVSRQ